jgi:hypothetical protein
MNAPRYASGDDVVIGDRVDYAGRRVVIILDTDSFSSSFPQSEWSYLGRGFMLEVGGYGLVHLEQSDQDLRLVARATI